jgi:hypothetical protein
MERAVNCAAKLFSTVVHASLNVMVVISIPTTPSEALERMKDRIA